MAPFFIGLFFLRAVFFMCFIDFQAVYDQLQF